MKKIQYTTPYISLFQVEPNGMLAGSLTGTNTEGLSVSNENYEDEARVKKVVDYDVWDDDWSK
ncbi:MAG: hypothetical protein K6C30_01430 [Bacteroidaceae bacterium]|nr:hypothetical protein [Bacteroidaceae bacterium]